MQSKFTTSGATNSGVPKSTWNSHNILVEFLFDKYLLGLNNYPEALVWIELAGQTEVNDLDAIALLCEYQNVFGLQVQVDDAIPMYEGHGLTDLANKHSADPFGEDEFIIYNAIEQFSTLNAVNIFQI